MEHKNYPEEGEIILIDKELHWTSFQVVKKIKNVLYKRSGIKKLKVGHAGTLDPLASGLVIVCTGKQTKRIQYFQDQEKEYVAEIKFGETTPSFDLETDPDKKYPVEHLTEDGVLNALKSFKGEQQQVPPIFSAKNLNGKRAYEYARKGKEIELKPNRVVFYSLELMDYRKPCVKVKIECSKGTYIRAFARDLGNAMNTGAHLTALRRTRIGNYKVENAMTIENFVRKNSVTIDND